MLSVVSVLYIKSLYKNKELTKSLNTKEIQTNTEISIESNKIGEILLRDKLLNLNYWTTLNIEGLEANYPISYIFKIIKEENSYKKYELNSPEYFYWLFGEKNSEYKNIITIEVLENKEEYNTLEFIENNEMFDKEYIYNPSENNLPKLKELILGRIDKNSNYYNENIKNKEITIDNKKGIEINYCGYECDGYSLYISNKDNFYILSIINANQTGSKVTDKSLEVWEILKSNMKFNHTATQIQ